MMVESVQYVSFSNLMWKDVRTFHINSDNSKASHNSRRGKLIVLRGATCDFAQSKRTTIPETSKIHKYVHAP